MRVQKTETKKAGKSSVKASTIFNALITNNERMNAENNPPSDSGIESLEKKIQLNPTQTNAE
jgi:hypothetical protein